MFTLFNAIQKAQADFIQAANKFNPEFIEEFSLAADENDNSDLIYVEGEWLDIIMLGQKYKELREAKG